MEIKNKDRKLRWLRKYKRYLEYWLKKTNESINKISNSK